MGISIWQLLIVLVIVLLLFGTKKLRNMGGDLGAAIRNFRGAVKEGGDEGEGRGGDGPDRGRNGAGSRRRDGVREGARERCDALDIIPHRPCAFPGRGGARIGFRLRGLRVRHPGPVAPRTGVRRA